METLEERIKKHSELMHFAGDVLQLLSSDKLLQKSSESSESVRKIASKVNKSKDITSKTINGN